MSGEGGVSVVPQYGKWGGNGANDAWVWGQQVADYVRAVDPTNSMLNDLVWGPNNVLARDPANAAAIFSWKR